MSSGEPKAAAPGLRILIVEDETMIAMLVEDMLAELGHMTVGIASNLEEAGRLAAEADFNAALLDVNLSGKTVDPIANALAQRGIPFAFTTGIDQSGIPQAYRDRVTLQKPYVIEQLKDALARMMRPRQDL
jgi:CheY-like chemotaxis protein